MLTKAHIPTIVEFLSKSFEEFSELTEDEKVNQSGLAKIFQWRLINPFSIYFHWLDGYYLTYLTVPPNLYST